MEIIAFSSGKGGTGKTLMVSCFGYSLVRAKQRVLLVDADPATDGLSLFLLGTQGSRQVGSFEESNTFVGLLRVFRETGTINFEARRVNRSEPNELGGHGVSYEVLISGKGMYGDELAKAANPAVPDLDQGTFRQAIAAFFENLRAKSEYDYVLVDTRGGFAFETTDVCALADSFIVVTEPDFTSFYQDRNLVKRVSASAEKLNARAHCCGPSS
jgi:flagellar biosynthesis protein FlhG